ncbi:MAG TPA: hypothetical protein VFO85_07335 [Vicinamibacteria bacterium]|nr:hypothetical protein [Vicinamibacteria bacterium]
MKAAVRELLERALELARAGVRVYEAALGCAVHDQLEEQWQDDLSQIRRHERALRTAATRMGVDPEAETSLRLVVRQQARAITEALEQASAKAPDAEAERLAAECVLEWESRTRVAWDLLYELAAITTDEVGEALRTACAEAPDQQEERVHRARAWARSLWLAALGRPNAVPARRKRPRRPRASPPSNAGAA